jgi:ATP-binding cassette, subfamily B (MDR/TAP), member 1
VVVAFGQEQTESAIYNRFLEDAKKISRAGSMGAGIAMGFFICTIYLGYAYAFWLGGYFVDNDVQNTIAGRTYTGGDCISIFFGVLFGLFAGSSASPQIAAIMEGKSAAKLALEIINRQPLINQDSQTSIKHEVQGKIEFKKVKFYYPTRPGQLILDDVDLSFEVGKMTAIVGPSGSGKSTIVQLIERFYEPTEGEVLIDGVQLNRINLRDYRR